jgi:hypothetical protein
MANKPHHSDSGAPHSGDPDSSGANPGFSLFKGEKGKGKGKEEGEKGEEGKEDKKGKEDKIDNSKYKEAIQDLYSFVKKKPLFGTKNEALQKIWSEELTKAVAVLPTEAPKDEAEGKTNKTKFDALFSDIKAAAASSKAPSKAEPSKATPSAADPSAVDSSAAAELKESAVGGGLFGDKKPIDVYVGFVDDLVSEKDKGKFKNLVDTLKVEDMFKDGSMLFEWKDYKGNFKAVRIGDVKSISACKEDQVKLKKEIDKKKEKEKGASKGGAEPVADDASATKTVTPAPKPPDATADKPADASAPGSAPGSAASSAPARRQTR